MSLIWQSPRKPCQSVKICRPAQAKQTGPNRSKIIKKQDFISRSVIEESRKTLVDIANENLRFRRMLDILKGNF